MSSKARRLSNVSVKFQKAEPFCHQPAERLFCHGLFFRIWAAIMGSNRVLRGGNWNGNALNCRSANRNHADPSNRNDNIGFRLVFVP